jgi:hypothetical protein
LRLHFSWGWGAAVARPLAQLWHPSSPEDKGPALSDGAGNLPTHVDLDTGTRPSDLDVRLSMPAPFLDDHLAITAASADRYVAIPLDATLVAHRADAVSVTDPLRARRQREQGRPCHEGRECKGMS